MSIAVGTVWGIMTVSVMYITIKYYLPRLHMTRAVPTSKVQKQSEVRKNEKLSSHLVVNIDESTRIITQRRRNLLLILGSGTFAVFCGYYAGESATSWISLMKMTLTFAILSCAFITDLEFLIIPNLCPCVLIVGRLTIAIFEFIFLKSEAMLWLSNSIVALVISLLFMFIMSKITGGGIGMGDVKLFSGVGFVCGIQAVCFTLVIAFFVCALVSVGMLLTKKRGLKDSLPMGPFIWIGFGFTVILQII